MEEMEEVQVKANNPPQNKRKSIAILLFCGLECLFFAGALFGWPSVHYILREDGVFAQFCPTGEMNTNPVLTNVTNHDSEASYKTKRDSDVHLNGLAVTSGPHLPGHNISDSLNKTGSVTCQEQDSKLSIAFIFGIAAFNILAFLNGWLYDKYGLRTLRIAAWILATLGYVVLAFSQKGPSSWLIYLGMTLIGTGSNILFMVNCHTCTLAGRFTSTFITLYGGALNTSAGMYLLFKLIYEAGIPRAYIVSAYAAAFVLTLLNTIFLLPKDKVKPVEKVEANETEMKPLDAAEKEEGPSVKSEILSPLYLILLFWFSMLHLRAMCFIGFFSSWLQHVTGSRDNESEYTTTFGLIQLSSILISPVAGILIDINRKRLQRKNIVGVKRAIATLPSVTIGSVTGIIVAVLVFIKLPSLIYLTMVMAEILRGFIYCTAVALIEIGFPNKHYGTLFGFAFFAVGVASFLQFPYTAWLEISGFININILLLVTSCASIVLPIFILGRHLYHGSKGSSSTGN